MLAAIKSVHLTNYYHKNSGGISTAYNKLLEAANRRGRYVRLIVPGETTETEEVGEFGRIYYVKAGHSPLFDKRYRVLMPWNSYIFDQSPIKKILRHEKPDIIEIGEKYSLSLMAGLIRKGVMNISSPRPMLVHLSCERMDDNIRAFVSAGSAGKRFSREFIRNYVFPMFDFHLTNSDYTARELIDAVSPENDRQGKNKFFNYSWRLFRSAKLPASERIFVNQCGVDNQTFSISRKSAEVRARIRHDYDIPETARILLYAGRLSPEKNVALLPELMNLLARGGGHNFRLLVAGDGPSYKDLAAEFERVAAGTVRMLGHLNDIEQLADIFANCDAFVHPNPREPFGITPLEAMSSGLAVVAPNSGGVLSYANSDNAWLVDPTPRSFAAAVRSVFDDIGSTRSKIADALDTSRSYTWKSSTDRLFDLYDKMFAQFSKNRDDYDYKKAANDFDFAAEVNANS